MSPELALALARFGIFLLGGLLFVHVGRQFRLPTAENARIASPNDVPWKLLAWAFLVMAGQSLAHSCLLIVTNSPQSESRWEPLFIVLSTLNNILFLTAAARIPCASKWTAFFAYKPLRLITFGAIIIAVSFIVLGFFNVTVPLFSFDFVVAKIPDVVFSLFVIILMTQTIARGLLMQHYSSAWVLLFVASQIILILCQIMLATPTPSLFISICNFGSIFNLLLALVLLGLWLVNEDRIRLVTQGRQALSGIDDALETVSKISTSKTCEDTAMLIADLNMQLNNSKQCLPFRISKFGDTLPGNFIDSTDDSIAIGEALFDRIAHSIEETKGIVAIDLRNYKTLKGKEPEYIVGENEGHVLGEARKRFGEKHFYVVELDPWFSNDK